MLAQLSPAASVLVPTVAVFALLGVLALLYYRPFTKVPESAAAYRLVLGDPRGEVGPGWTLDVSLLYEVHTVETEPTTVSHAVDVVTADDVGATADLGVTLAPADPEQLVGLEELPEGELHRTEPAYELPWIATRVVRGELSGVELDAFFDDTEAVEEQLRRALDARLADEAMAVEGVDLRSVEAPAREREAATT